MIVPVLLVMLSVISSSIARRQLAFSSSVLGPRQQIQSISTFLPGPRYSAMILTNTRLSFLLSPKTINHRHSVTMMSTYATESDTMLSPQGNSQSKGVLPSYVTQEKFADQRISRSTKKAIEQVLKLERMTEIQVKALEPVISGKDVLARARTGTGKTVAFLVPSLEKLTKGPGVDVLIISPTRELATQIGTQANDLLKYHTNACSQVVFGGTNVNSDIMKFQKTKPSVVVATPGRLLDLLTNGKLANSEPIADYFDNLKVLVLDEADHLMDQGFERDIMKIVQMLPPPPPSGASSKGRQTLMFSATLPPPLLKVMSSALRPNFETIDCVNELEATSETNIQVPQKHVMIPSMQRSLSGILEAVQRAMQQAQAQGVDHKIIVFFSTAHFTGFMALLAISVGMDVHQLHSRLSQPKRDKASESFRKSKKAVLFTSNVSARGVDYPDVTHVIQVGMPDNRAQYIHRIGRTGRAGKAGESLLMLFPHEKAFLREISEFDVPEDGELSTILNNPVNSSLNAKLSQSLKRVNELALSYSFDDQNIDLTRDQRQGAPLTKAAMASYKAWLGFYMQQKSRSSDKTVDAVVNRANELSSVIGFKQPPYLAKKVIGKMGLKGAKEIHVK